MKHSSAASMLRALGRVVKAGAVMAALASPVVFVPHQAHAQQEAAGATEGQREVMLVVGGQDVVTTSYSIGDISGGDRFFQ